MTDVVKLGFDPEQTFGEMWRDDIARTLWLLWRQKHIVPVGFEGECQAVAQQIAKVKPTTAVQLIRCFPILSDYWTPNDVERFAVDSLPYFTGDKSIGWEYVKR